MKNKVITVFIGFFIGIIGGLLGAGGGMLAVPALKRLGLSVKEAHENAVAVILPLAVFSAVFYLYRGNGTIGDVLIFVPSGLAGAGVGTFLLKKISPKWLTVIFGAFMIYSGVRMFIR